MTCLEVPCLLNQLQTLRGLRQHTGQHVLLSSQVSQDMLEHTSVSIQKVAAIVQEVSAAQPCEGSRRKCTSYRPWLSR